MKTVLTTSVALAALALAGCSNEQKTAAASETAPPPAVAATAPSSNGLVVVPADSPKLQQIKVEAVRSEEVPSEEVTAPGKIEMNPNRVSHVVLPLGGRVTSVLVKLGDFVKQGQPLLTVESPDTDQAMSTYLQSQAAVSTAKSAMLKAKGDADRLHDLDAHNAVAKKDVLNADATYQQSQAAVEQAEAIERQAVRRLEMLGVKPGEFGQKVTVRAPLSGKVMELNIATGEYRNDTNANLITIADLSSVWVSSDVPETAMRMIQPGEHIDVTLAAYPGQTFRGRVTRIADALDPTSRTIKVSAEIPNPGERLRPEMYGSIRHVESTRKAPVIPSQAVMQGDNQNVVYREIARGRFQTTPVTLGTRTGDRVAVLTGLQEGQRIVTDGVMLLQN